MKNDADLHINRGVDLMLRGNPPEIQESKTWEVRFGKLLSLFHREFDFYTDLPRYKKEVTPVGGKGHGNYISCNFCSD